MGREGGRESMGWGILKEFGVTKNVLLLDVSIVIKVSNL